MARRIGMNTATAHSVVNSVGGYSMALSAVQFEIQMARAMSMNPVSYSIDPGALLLSPISIVMAESAATDLANVKASLDYLMTKLSQEIMQQEDVSYSLTESDCGWYAQPPTVKKPNEQQMFGVDWNALAPLVDIGNKISFIHDWIELGEKTLNLPKPVMTALKWVVKGGKFIPFAGVAFSGAAIFTEWDDDNVWGNTRNFIGFGIDAVSVAIAPLLIPPATIAGAPAEVVVLGIGIAWDAFDMIWDASDEGDFDGLYKALGWA